MTTVIKKKLNRKNRVFGEILNICVLVFQVGTLFINVKFLKVFTFKGFKIVGHFCRVGRWVGKLQILTDRHNLSLCLNCATFFRTQPGAGRELYLYVFQLH